MLKRRLMSSFGWLNVTQFFGALNDNVFKFLVVFFLVGRLQHELNATQALATALFVIPFLLFSHAAGVLADRYSKRHIVVATKWVELGVMVLGLVALQFESVGLLYALVFVMCTQSAFFGPSKYGVIPELVGESRLSRANSLLVCFSYLAIIIGAFLPSFFIDFLFRDNYRALAGFCVLVAGAGLLASREIHVTPAVGERRRFTPYFVADMAKTFVGLRTDRYLQVALVGAGYFLFLAAFLQQTLLYYGVETLGLSVARSGYFFPIAALGIGGGALLAGRLSGRNIEIGVIPLGAIGLALWCLVLSAIPPAPLALAGLVLLLGFSAGLFIVPLQAFIQQRAPRERRGEILACTNFLSFLGAALSAGVFYGLARGLTLAPGVCFAIVGLLTALLAGITLWLLPDFLIRLLVVLLTRFIYRIRSHGLEHVPMRGGGLLVSNHVTWVDALLISATLQRRVRFMMARPIYETWWIQPLFRLMGVIPIHTADPPRRVVESLRAARRAMDDGYLVCIFAEGALTRNGNMRSFRGGYERIVKGTDHPVIPVHLGGAWGSIFSYYRGKLLAAFPRKIFYPVTVFYGPALLSTATPLEVRTAVCELSCEAFNARRGRGRTLAARFVRRARRYWFRRAVADTSGTALPFGRLLTGAIALGQRLRKGREEEAMIGIMLPASVGGAVANVAVTLLGKIPANLNFTASADAVASAIKQCDIKTVISSRRFLDQLSGVAPPPGTLYLEDLLPRISSVARVKALLSALMASPRQLAGGKCVSCDDPAAIVFSSGSTGDPKGIMLSHHNLLSNVEAIQLVFRLEPRDRFCAVLPFFHSFGLTATLWAPLVCGFSACYHPNPLDGAKIGNMVREHGLTAMVATPTFLLPYIRRAKPDDFQSLRAVVTGAEKLKPRTADAFERRFGLRPVEGYGATELSPVAAMNLPHVQPGATQQVGAKEGSVGHPVPGVAARVVDPDSGEVLGEDREGVLQIKGPNVMLGYWGRPKETADVLKNGWYSTGDLAKIDADGFVFLQDRLSRYSKIAGEMVPHLAVEEALAEALGSVEPCVVVAGAPDARKGEQLVVCHTPAAGSSARLHEIARASNLPNLWKPKKENYVQIESIPTLGSGKLDLKAIRKLAREFVENRPGAVERVVTKLRESF